MEDGSIIELYWKRDESAIAETSQKYGAYCFSVADNILHSAEDSEECVNETWFRAWNAMPPHRPDRLKLFLAKITRNLSFDRFASKTAKKRGGGELTAVLEELGGCVGAADGAEAEVEAKELGRFISGFVSSLPERDGNVAIRRYFFAEPVADIAKRYRITENNVSVILSRIRKKLKSELEKEGYI